MKTIHVCTHCGSADIVQDAWVHYNDRDDVATFDDLYFASRSAVALSALS